MKFRPVAAELFYADGRTDMTNVLVVSRNFAKAPKKGQAIPAHAMKAI